MSKKAVRKFNRSGKNNCPICDRQCRLVEHHLNGRDIHNWNKPSNTAWICGACHDMVHTGDIIIEAWLMTSGGRKLFFHYQGEPSITGLASTPPIYNSSINKKSSL